MIVSASRRTDIPAFHGEWFVERLRAGWVEVRNPFNPKQVRKVSLQPEDVDACVFWTKNPAPFIRHLDELDSAGYRYYFQFTLNAYGSELEPGVPQEAARLDSFACLSDRLGPRRVIWRYDPIVLSSLTPPDFHLKAFERLVRSLRGRTKRVVISLVEYYRKIDRRLRCLEAAGVRFERQAIGQDVTRRLLSELRAMACDCDMEMQTCASGVDFSDLGIRPGACIDGLLIRELWDREVPLTKDPGQRPHCRCVMSRDIGTNDTCAHGCLYCYANR